MQKDTEHNSSTRLPDGRFKAGISGNPNGRPRAENATLRIQLSEKGVEVVNKVLKAALSGDMQACKMVLDRISPTLRPQTASIVIDTPLPKSISEIARVFVEAAANGQLPPDTATQLVTAVGTLARVIEVDELKARLESLERSLQDK